LAKFVSCKNTEGTAKMAKSKTISGSDLFIVDNSEANWKVLNYLREWAEISHKIDDTEDWISRHRTWT
jgi:hypothetical protein